MGLPGKSGVLERISPHFIDNSPLVERRSIRQSLGNVIRITGFTIATLLPNSAASDSVYHGPEPTLSDISAGQTIRTGIQLQVDGIMHPLADRYRGILWEADYEVIDQEGFLQFLQKFEGVLGYLYERGVLLGWDINNAMNVYSSWQLREESPNEFMMFYAEFLAGYPAMREELIVELKHIGIEPIPDENQDL